jgi:peptidoglycan/LPS O-acetylase OafA/YrhL
MSELAMIQLIARAGALFCAGAYIYAFVFRSRGDRRWHTASLLCTGLALCGLSVLIAPQGADTTLAAASTVALMLASIATQSMAAFRGRRGDARRGVEERRAPRPENATARA